MWYIILCSGSLLLGYLLGVSIGIGKGFDQGWDLCVATMEGAHNGCEPE